MSATGEEVPEPLRARSAAALELLTRAVAAINRLGGASELRPLADALAARLGREEALIELSGPEAGAAACSLIGESVVARVIGAGVVARLRAAPAFSFRARFADGRSETMPLDRTGELAARLEESERALAHETENARGLVARTQEAAREAAQARAAHTSACEALAALTTLTTMTTVTTVNEPARSRRAGSLAILRAGTLEPPPPRRFWLWAALAWLLALFFGRRRTRPVERSIREPAKGGALPEAPSVTEGERERALAAAERRVVAGEAASLATERARERIEAALDESKRCAAIHASDREQRLRELEEYRAARRRQTITRMAELSGASAAPPRELDFEAPGLPDGVVLLLGAIAPAERAATDGNLRPGEQTSAEELRQELAELRRARRVKAARFAAAALCSCRNQIVDLERRAQTAHRERVSELQACQVDAPDALRAQKQTEAQRPVARHAEEIVQEAAARLERLLAEARASWEERISACVGVEQLRTEVAAIENGAAHRLSLVCDELRESMTIQAVRLVLELSRPLRQELLQKRLEVARGRSAKAEESFEDIRVVLPASLDDTFKALRAPGVGELLPSTRSLFDPLFRTLAREKRECIARLNARLDEVGQSTARELYAAAVYLSPLLVTRFGRLLEELLAVHERWIEGRAAEEQHDYDDLRARQAPALALLAPLEEEEGALARLLERTGEIAAG